MSLRTCAGCSTRYAPDLAQCPHCRDTGYTEGEQPVNRLPSFVAVFCTFCGWGPRQLRLNSPHPGLIELPTLFCASCGRQVQVPWPPEEETMSPKITVHGGATNARAADPSPAVSASLPPVVAEGGRGLPTPTLVGEPGPELTDLPTAGEQAVAEVPAFVAELLEPAATEPVSYDGMTLAELRTAAESRGLPSYGSKNQITERLREADTEG